MGQVLRPVFGNLKNTTQVMTWTGRTVLMSVAPAPETAFNEEAAPEFCYTFLRAGLNGEKPAAPGKAKPAGMVAQRRLHLLSVRLQRNEAAALLLLHAGDDAALYAALGQQVIAGTAALTGHTSVLCRSGQSCQMQSKALFEEPGSYVDLIPRRG